jgi:hypothetical protein
MRRIVVRYKTKPEQSDENRRLVENVFQELRSERPDGLRYATLRLADGVTFVHVAVIETDDGSNPLAANAAFTEFQRAIEDRCTEPPAPQDATVVGSYRLFAD